jgi:hypothetical protein
MAPFESPLEAGWETAADDEDCGAALVEDARVVEGEVVEDTFEELELLVRDSPVVVEDAMVEDDSWVLVLVVKRAEDVNEAWAVVALDDATEEEFCNPSTI